MNTFKQTTKEQRPNQKCSCKINSVCISRHHVEICVGLKISLSKSCAEGQKDMTRTANRLLLTLNEHSLELFVAGISN